MPLKRNKRRRNNLTYTQKKKIQSRLMAISLEIDDYLYQHKPTLPIADAETYIKEVESYKTQCSERDVRTLQVIEKITRYMNTLIKEQQEPIRSPSYSTQTHCPSPVYSLPDEDKILLSENPINGTKGEEINKGNTTIDLCDDDDVVVHEKVQVYAEVHRAMSGLSITEEDPTDELDYSQSILDNFELNTKKIEANKIDNTVNKLDLNKNNSSLKAIDRGTKSKTIFNKEIVEQSPKNLQWDVRFQISKEQNKPSRILENANNISNAVLRKPYILRNDNVGKTKRERTVNKSYINKENSTQKKCTEINKKTKRKVYNKNKNNTDKSIDLNDNKKVGSSNSCDNSVRVYKTNVHALKTNRETAQVVKKTKIEALKTNLKASQNFVQVPLPNVTSFALNSNSTDKSAIIYNTSVENDLSWIENIRYVREISNEENDNKFINSEDSFWNNCEFPSNWNDADFNY